MAVVVTPILLLTYTFSHIHLHYNIIPWNLYNFTIASFQFQGYLFPIHNNIKESLPMGNYIMQISNLLSDFHYISSPPSSIN